MIGSPQSAPLYESLEALAARDTLRFHMPGHKGRPVFSAFADVFPLDFTETYGTGNLYEEEGPIRAAEQLAARYYGAHDCHFLTGGSSQGIHAMLGAVCGFEGQVLLDRACHKSTAAACALFGLSPTFVYPETAEPFGFSGLLDIGEVARALAAAPAAKALLVVSPSYHGVVQDIPALAELCHSAGKMLLVDAAHGAHFPAVGLPSPVQAGADAAVLSAHKTLPALGQGAFLLLADTVDTRKMRQTEAMCGTSSPSYPIMASLDLSRAWLEGVGRHAYRTIMGANARLREAIDTRTPFRAVGTRDFARLDPCRLTVFCAQAGISGHALAQRLFAEHGIVCEMADERNIVCIITGADKPVDLLRLRRALVREGKRLPAEAPPLPPLPAMPHSIRERSVRDAWFAPHETVPLADAAGRVCARAVTPYPPGIPLLWPGEKITPAHIEFLTHRCYTKEEKLAVLRLPRDL